MYCSYWTWTQSGASYFLNTLALAEGTTVEWGRIGAGPCTLLKASPASAVTHWPLSPGRPASVHWKAREKVWLHKQAILVSPKVPPALGYAASKSSHNWWLGRAWEATLNRHKPMSPTYQMYSIPEVIVQVKEIRMLNEKHHLMTIRAGRWPAFSWKPTWPSTKHLVVCTWPKSLQVQKAPTALPARSLHSESCTIFQTEITCTPACSQMYPSSMHAERPPCFD